jgi:hypothetical protein
MKRTMAKNGSIAAKVDVDRVRAARRQVLRRPGASW